MDFWRKTKGAVSIFLVLILVPMLTVSSLFVDASKVKLAKAMMESAGDLSLNTALTDYDTKLKELYGLLATAQDTSDLFSKLEDYYRTCITSSGVSNEDAKTYAEQIMAQLGIVAENDDTADLMNMELSDFEVQKYPSGNLANSTVLKKQIVDFMKYRAPINTGMNFISSLKSFSTISKQTELVEKKQDYYEKQQTVLENLQSAWKEIAGYNNSAFVKDPNYLSNMKTTLGKYGEKYKDYGKRTIMSLYKKYDPIVQYTFDCYVAENNQAKDGFDFSTGKHSGNATKAWLIIYGGESYYSYLSESYKNSYNTGTPKLPTIKEIQKAVTSYYNAQKTDELKNAPHYETNYYNIQFFAQKKSEIETYISSQINYFIAYQNLKNILTWIEGYDSVEINDSNGNRITPESIYDTDLTIDGHTKTISSWISELSIDSYYESRMWALHENTEIWNIHAKDAKDEYYKQFSITSDTDISTAVNSIYTEINGYVKTLEDSIAFLDNAMKYLTAAKTQLTGPVADAKKEWSGVASDKAISDTSLAKQDQAEINQLDTYLNEANIDKLIKRLDNVKTDLTNVLNQVKEFKFADVFIGEIDGYDKLETVCGEKWKDLNVLSMVKEKITNTATSRAAGAWHQGDIKLDWIKQSMHQPDLTQDKVSLYTYLSSHFAGTEPAESSPSTNVKEEDPSNGKTLYNNIKKQSETTANDKSKNADNGQASDETKNNNISAEAGIPSKLPKIINNVDTPSGSVNTKIDKDADNGEKGAAGKSASTLNGLFGENFLSSVASFGTDLRDKLYVADYIMSMFSYDTIENEYIVKHDDVDSIKPGMLLSLTKNDISKENNYAYGAEVEYIIFGGTNSQNLIKSYGSIYAIRFGFNLVYAFATSEIRDSALAIATPISAATLGIIPVPLIQAVIIIGIACCESAIDLCELRDGHSVPLYKSSKTWHCSMTGLINLAKKEVGKIIKDTASALIDEGVNELNKYLDMSEEELNKLIQGGSKKITDSVESAYDKIITEKANAAIQQLTTLVNTSVESLRCFSGDEYEIKKGESITWIKSQLQSWADSHEGDGIASKVAKEAVRIIISESDSFINDLFSTVENQLKDSTPESTINSLLSGTEDAFNQVGGEVMKKIEEIRNAISSKIKDASSEIQKFIKNSVDKISKSINEGAGKLKDSINDSIDGLFGNDTDGSDGSDIASFFAFSYSDYLRLFLLIGLYTNEEKIILRTADVIQVNMSKQIIHEDYSLVQSAAYVNVYAKVLVKPTLISLPLFANVENNPSTNTSWYTVECNGIAGY